MRTTWLATGWAAAIVLLGWVGGCGGNVVVDEGHGGSTSNGSQSNGSQMTTTGPEPQTICQQLCLKGQSLSCLGDSFDQCVKDCVLSFEQSANCTGELTVLIDCFVANATNCDFPDACQTALNKYDECLNGGSCGVIGCSASDDGSCACEGMCNGQQLSNACKPSANGALLCECMINGMLVGTCQDGNPTCDLMNGCCAPFFFGFGE